MKRLLLGLLLFAVPCAFGQLGLRGLRTVRPDPANPDVPVVDPDPAFPLRVHVFVARWGGLGSRNHGFGTGNLLDGAHLAGFDYAFQCGVPFVPNQAATDTYQARWKRSPYQLEILTGELGGKHQHTCNLHLVMEARPFDETNRARYPHGVSSSLRVPWLDPDFAYQSPIPTTPSSSMCWMPKGWKMSTQTMAGAQPTSPSLHPVPRSRVPTSSTSAAAASSPTRS